ncbi:hypothetical protein KAT82_00805 [bacterium]|nr:hypothetical protein [bacterium]
MVKAFSVLDSIDSSRLSAQALSAAECLRRAFADPPRAEDLPPLSQRVLISYRHYWQTLMLRRSPVEDAEAELLASLNTILAGTAAAATGLGDLDAASEHAKGAIENEGLFALTGVTSPYYELMIWRVESPRTYRVALPECVIDVRVVFLDEFASLGWAGFATCGRYYSAGWATEDSLFAVQSAHETESEGFRVSYLAHEGRHFSDYKEFPKLEQSELEYRAKLTEIAVSENSTHDLIVMFSRRTGQDRAAPHHFANYWVTKNLGRAVFNSGAPVKDAAEWRSVPAGQLRREARHLLLDSSVHLQNVGATTVERFLS